MPHALGDWVERDEIDLHCLKELHWWGRELRRANEIPKLVGAFFAQAELDRRLKS